MKYEPVPDQPPPLLCGPLELVEGYYDLEKYERNQTLHALREHTDAVALWYRGLTLYRRAVLTRWTLKGEQGSPELAASGLQMHLLCLAVSSMKAALDMLLAGYYSIAFGIIRHMLETCVQCIYVGYEPDEARHWYEPEEGVATRSQPPDMVEMCQQIKAIPEDCENKGLHHLLDRIYTSWRLMSVGAHPSGEGITQTQVEGSAKVFIGATYKRDWCLAGFDVGFTPLTNYLPKLLVRIKPEVALLIDEWTALKADVGAWRAKHEVELRANQPPMPSQPPRVPDPSIEDVRRCWKLIRAREVSMNRLRAKSIAPVSTNDDGVATVRTGA